MTETEISAEMTENHTLSQAQFIGSRLYFSSGPLLPELKDDRMFMNSGCMRSSRTTQLDYKLQYSEGGEQTLLGAALTFDPRQPLMQGDL